MSEFDYAIYSCAGDGNFGSDMMLAGYIVAYGGFRDWLTYIIIVNEECDIDWFKATFPDSDQDYVTWAVNTDANIQKMVGCTEIAVVLGGCLDTPARIASMRTLLQSQVDAGKRYRLYKVGVQGYQQSADGTWIIQNSYWPYLREANSRDIAATLGVSPASLYNDSSEYVMTSNSFVDGTAVPNPHVRIGLSVGNKDYHYDCTTRWRFCEMLSQVHSTLTNTHGWTVTWVGIVQSVGQRGSDYMDDRNVFDYLIAEDIIPITYTTPATYVEYLAQYDAGGSNQLDIVIGAGRFHALFCGYFMGFPTIAYYLTDPIMHKYQACAERYPSIDVVLDYDTDEASGPATSAANMVTACISAYDAGHPS
jgi:hypothetical protein